MTDTATELKVTAASDIEVDRDALDSSIREFAQVNGDYYIGAFHKIHDATGLLPNTFNLWAAVLGPLWAASRAIWGMFWTFLILEVIAWVQIGRGWWGNPGADMAERAARQSARAQELLDKAAAATEQADIDRFNKLAANIQSAADKSIAQAEAAQAEAFSIMLSGFLLLLIFKLVQGFYADRAYEKQYSQWRIDPDGTESGRSQRNTMMGAVLAAAIGPLIVYKFTVNKSLALLEQFPEDRASALILGEGNGTLFSRVASWMEARIDAAAAAGGDIFDGIVYGVRVVLDTLTVALNGSPWPVVMLVIAVTAWRAAGPRVAIFTVAAMAYTALLGYWEIAMETVALVGASVILCVVIGIPLGIWFGKSRRAYKAAEPVLDLMQTLPAFVYLIPIIAFFGTGNPPGILATIIFGMPPVIRLTALGMRGVPESIKEAAVAFGASKWQLLKDVEIPLALPSIMTGVNQTILMCLSMVVIISLIGGGGLGKEILEALQYAAKGPGLLGGFAILFLAMVMDRIVQGAFRREDQKD
ncbi:ABC transporter permease subunit [Roseovarius sp. CAU 1744]|uniref:ABC transporter permease n=1 Tax=Roseovarius sp. CAU 1744 TaxID=3140368 RepID=UPI00325C2164